ncbi:MAG: DNA polymerase III subunit gamma and tau, partial [Streptosporangiaceae bacterium]
PEPPKPVQKAAEGWAPPPAGPAAPAAPDLPPPPDGPTDESDEVDPVGDAVAPAETVGGVALIQRELGGQVIRELDNS